MDEKQLSSTLLAIRMVYESPVADELCEALKKLCFANLGRDYAAKHIAELEAEKLEILDRLVRLESENATLRAKADKDYKGYKFR